MTTDWLSFKFEIPGQDLLEGVRGVLETLLIFLEILKAILQTIQIFLIDFGNPIKALVEALIKLILELFESLKKTGFYGYYDIPNPIGDPNFFQHLGGYQAFITRFKGSVLDTRDPNRPQPTPGFNQSGFMLFVVDASNVPQLLRLIQALLKFFGKDFIAPQYGPPANAKAFPVGDANDPILAVSKVFAKQPKAIAVEWSLPTNQQPPDPGFSDLATTVGIEFIPPKFLIERSARPLNEEIDASAITDEDSVGIVTTEVETPFEARGKPGKKLKRKVKVVDDYGDPVIKFQKYIVVDVSSNTGTFLLGQLGKFRYIDKDVSFDTTYFYRVRAFSGDLSVSDGKMSFTVPEKPENMGQNNGQMVVKWPGTATVGRSSGVIRTRLAKMPANFDVIDNLQRLFQTAFCLNFHLAIPKGITVNAAGTPSDATRVDVIGMGSLQRQAGSLGGIELRPLTGPYASDKGVQLGVDKSPGTYTGLNPVDGSAILQPWQEKAVRRTSSRLANDVASALLESGSNLINAFQTLMQGPPPAGAISTKGFDGATTIEKMCRQLTDVPSEGVVAADGAQRYGYAYADETFRRNIVLAINFVTSFTLGGVPPDWVRVSLLRDVIPWSASMLYDLMAKIQALADAYRGVMDDIKAFIDMLIRKIDVLERFIQYLISLLDFVLSLSIGAYILFLPSTGDGIPGWFQAIDNAGGSKPPSGPTGYSAGVSLAYVAPDVSGFIEPLKLIFGG